MEAERQSTLKTAFIWGAILISLIAVLLIYGQRQRLKSQKALFKKYEEVKAANFRQQLTELEKKALQAQINPHFTFNCLNSINQLILTGNNDHASSYLTKFSKLIRLQLENADATEVTLKNEISLLESYIQLEELRFKGSIDYKIEIADGLDPDAIYLPPMVLQPFVENAIWHGLLHKKEKDQSILYILIKVVDDQLQCIIEDNGVGRKKSLALKQESVVKKKSLGMKITEDRLKLLNGELQQDFVKVEDLEDECGNALGTRVEVNIPTP